MRLHNQVAIVTGAGRNIGEDISKLFVQEGAKVAVVDLDQGRVLPDVTAVVLTALGCRADIADAGVVEQLEPPRLDETSGTTAANAAGAASNGTYTGVTLGAPGLIGSASDKAVTFSGTNSRVAMR